MDDAKLTKRLGRSCSSALLPASVILLLLSCSESGVRLHYYQERHKGFVSRRHVGAQLREESNGNSVGSDLLFITP